MSTVYVNEHPTEIPTTKYIPRYLFKTRKAKTISVLVAHELVLSSPFFRDRKTETSVSGKFYANN